MKRDLPDLTLAAVVRLLPSHRREWGRAMRSELAGVSGSERWRFALGCGRAVLTQRTVWRGFGYDGLAVAVVATAVWFSSSVRYAPLRWGFVAMVTVLVAIAWAGRAGGALAVRSGPAATLVRLCGYAVVATLIVAFVWSLMRKNDPVEQARVGLPILGTVLAAYLLGFVAMTARRSASSPLLGLVTGAAAAAGWTVIAIVAAPIPKTAGIGVLLIGAAVAVAAAVSRDRSAVAALGAGAWTAALIFTSVVLLSSYGPAWLIPDLAPLALSHADDLAQSRIEIQDPYIAILLMGALLSAAVALTSLLTRGRGEPAVDAAVSASG